LTSHQYPIKYSLDFINTNHYHSHSFLFLIEILNMFSPRTMAAASILTLSGFISACNNSTDTIEEDSSEQQQQLGKQLFFDASLSSPAGQSCSSCHLPSAGFADPDKEIPVSRGVHPERFGSRNTPSAAYASFSPEFHFDDEEGIFFGGQFLDGRAATLEEQAMRPFLNPLEMANADRTGGICRRIQSPLR